MNLSRGALGLLSLLLVFLVLGVGFGWQAVSEREAEADTPETELPEGVGVDSPNADIFAGAPEVGWAEVVRDTLWIQVVATGEVGAYRSSRVPTRTGGVVEQVFVIEGERVEEGQILVQVDTAEAALSVQQAESALRIARADYEVRMLGADPSRSDSAQAERERRVRAMSGLDGAERNLERARREMEWTQVRAPFAGVVADLVAVEGAFLSPGGEALTLLQLDPIRVEVNALESDVAYLQPGRRASVHLRALAHETFSAHVASVNPLVERETGSTRVTLEMPNPDHLVLPGMFARVSVNARSYADRVLVPRDAITERDRREVVFVVRDVNERGQGITERRVVTTGFRNDEYVEIIPHVETSMVEPGEIVLVRGHGTIATDIPVRLTDPERLADRASAPASEGR